MQRYGYEFHGNEFTLPVAAGNAPIERCARFGISLSKWIRRLPSTSGDVSSRAVDASIDRLR